MRYIPAFLYPEHTTCPSASRLAGSQLAGLLLLALAVCLSGCGGSSAPKGIPRDMNFKRYQPIMMNVGKIDIFEDYQSPRREPYVEHLLPITPAEAMKKWVDDRLRVAGMDKALHVIIKDASVISSPLPKPDGVSGLVSLGNDRRYDAKLTVDMRIYGSGAMSEASIEVTATRSITIPESASVNERRATFHHMIFELMESMNAALEKNMFQYFGNHIVF
jgi:hypothetical protein